MSRKPKLPVNPPRTAKRWWTVIEHVSSRSPALCRSGCSLGVHHRPIVTFAREGASAATLLLLTLGTLPGVQVLVGPIIDRFKSPNWGVVVRGFSLPNGHGGAARHHASYFLTNNISLLGALFFVYNVFTAARCLNRRLGCRRAPIPRV